MKSLSFNIFNGSYHFPLTMGTNYINPLTRDERLFMKH